MSSIWLGSISCGFCSRDILPLLAFHPPHRPGLPHGCQRPDRSAGQRRDGAQPRSLVPASFPGIISLEGCGSGHSLRDVVTPSPGGLKGLRHALCTGAGLSLRTHRWASIGFRVAVHELARVCVRVLELVAGPPFPLVRLRLPHTGGARLAGRVLHGPQDPQSTQRMQRRNSVRYMGDRRRALLLPVARRVMIRNRLKLALAT